MGTDSTDKNHAAKRLDMRHSRIMIDPVTFRQQNPSFLEVSDLPISFTNDEETLSRGMRPQSLLHMSPIRMANDLIRSLQDNNTPGSEDAQLEEARNTLLLVCSPFILGYSLDRLDWFEFDIRGIEDIEWSDEAWNSLVLEPKLKELIRASVASQLSNLARSVFDAVVPFGEKGLTSKLSNPHMD